MYQLLILDFCCNLFLIEQYILLGFFFYLLHRHRPQQTLLTITVVLLIFIKYFRKHVQIAAMPRLLFQFQEMQYFIGLRLQSVQFTVYLYEACRNHSIHIVEWHCHFIDLLDRHPSIQSLKAHSSSNYLFSLRIRLYDIAYCAKFILAQKARYSLWINSNKQLFFRSDFRRNRLNYGSCRF